MSNLFQSECFPKPYPNLNWYILGSVGAPVMNPIVHSLYPMEMMTKLHELQHWKGLTGTWMDIVPGRLVSGGWHHRLQHGHHLFGDGMKVLTTPKLKFGQFLHHLGCDFLTKAGIPNPLLPTGTLFKGLQSLGFSATTASELLTVNLPKVPAA